MYNQTVINNIKVNYLQTKTFKSTRIRVAFLAPLTQKGATLRAILPYIMRSGSKTFPDRSDIAKKVYDLYNAKFNVGVSKKGASHLILFDLAIINNQYTLDKENLLEEGLSFLHDVIYNPLLSVEHYEEEYRLMEEYYQSIYANKMRYTIQEMSNIMFKDELYKINALGDHETLKGITYQDVLEEYQSMIKNNQLVITVVSDQREEHVLGVVARYFQSSSDGRKLMLIEKDQKPIHQVEVKEIIQDVNQAKLVLGYRLPVFYKEESYYKALLFDTVLGGSSESLLFQRLREELGLVYTVQSSYNPFKGVFFIYLGMDQKEYHRVIEEIKEIVSLQHKELEHYLTIAKQTYINQLIQSYDSLSGLAYKVEHSALYDVVLSKEETIRCVQNVTVSDLMHIASLLELDTIGYLRGEDDE